MRELGRGILAAWCIVVVIVYGFGGLFACSWAINMAFYGINAATREHYQPVSILVWPLANLVFASIGYGAWWVVKGGRDDAD